MYLKTVTRIFQNATGLPLHRPYCNGLPHQTGQRYCVAVGTSCVFMITMPPVVTTLRVMVPTVAAPADGVISSHFARVPKLMFLHVNPQSQFFS